MAWTTKYVIRNTKINLETSENQEEKKIGLISADGEDRTTNRKDGECL